jgi:membrane-associated phospholipid phosphatase
MHGTFQFFLNFLLLLLSHFFHALQEIDFHILKAINHNRIESLDHFFIFITNIATVTTYAASIILLLYAIIKKKFFLQRKSWLIFISLISTSAIVDSLKHIIKRTRPFITYPSIHNLVNVSTPSFPSGHTAEVFVLATAIALLFQKQGWYILPVWIWAILVAYTRLVLGVHYPSDVLASIIIGVTMGIAFPRFLIKRGFLQHYTNPERLYSVRKE